MLYYYDILMIYIIVIHRQGIRNLLHSFADKKIYGIGFTMVIYIRDWF